MMRSVVAGSGEVLVVFEGGIAHTGALFAEEEDV